MPDRPPRPSGHPAHRHDRRCRRAGVQLVVPHRGAARRCPGTSGRRVQPGLGAWKYVVGLAFAVLLYLSVLLHEASHAAMARHYGFPVTSITLHFLGGVTAIEGEARIPAAGVLHRGGRSGDVDRRGTGGARRPRRRPRRPAPDGGRRAGRRQPAGRAAQPGSRSAAGRRTGAQGRRLGDRPATSIAGRSSPGGADAWPRSPSSPGRCSSSPCSGAPPTVIDFVLAFVVAAFLWSGATAAMSSARLRRKLPHLVARALARRTLSVPADLPLAEAVRRAQESEAGGIVTVTSGGPGGGSRQ